MLVLGVDMLMVVEGFHEYFIPSFAIYMPDKIKAVCSDVGVIHVLSQDSGG